MMAFSFYTFSSYPYHIHIDDLSSYPFLIMFHLIQVTKSRDLHTKQRSLTFEVDYPEAEEGLQPRHRFMSAYEQKVETADKQYQYLLFACDPYETIAFKIPNQPIDKREGRFFTSWDKKTHKFVLQLFFLVQKTLQG